MASNDDDEQQQQLNELQTRIDRLRLQVPLNPDDISSRGECHAMRNLELARNEKDLTMEKRRVDEVVTSFEQDHPISKSECEACSKALRMPTLDGALCKAFMADDEFDLESDDLIRAQLSLTLCCGKIVCMECFGEYATETCPCCRVGSMPSEPETILRKTLLLAEAGNAWAQFEAGLRLLQASEEDVSRNKKRSYIEQAVGWFRKAALQGVSAAAGTLVMKCKEHIADPEENRRWLNLAAELGDPSAQMILAATLDDEEGDDFNDVEAVKWYTLAIHRNGVGPKHGGAPFAAYNLASHFREGSAGLDVSLQRARHYYQIAVEDGVPDASYYMSMVLFKMGADVMHVPGCCTIPRALYWAKESLKRGDSCDASQLVPSLENGFKGKCAYCCEEVDNSLRCSQCKIFYYCSKGCQKKHWKDGHKYDCVALDV